MKVTVMNANDGKFEPVTITVTLESEVEVQELWHRMNISNSTMMATYDEDTSPGIPTTHRTMALYNAVNKIKNQRAIEVFL